LQLLSLNQSLQQLQAQLAEANSINANQRLENMNQQLLLQQQHQQIQQQQQQAHAQEIQALQLKLDSATAAAASSSLEAEAALARAAEMEAKARVLSAHWASCPYCIRHQAQSHLKAAAHARQEEAAAKAQLQVMRVMRSFNHVSCSTRCVDLRVCCV
jgi:chromosome segregation ATPase